MSKERAKARAAREHAAAARAEAESARERRGAVARTRRERSARAWRRSRLWQHGPQFRRRRETWGTIAVVALLVLLVAYLLTGSLVDVVGTALVLVIASPVVLALTFDRSRK